MIGLLFGKVRRVKIVTQQQLKKVHIHMDFVFRWAIFITIPQLLVQIIALMDPKKRTVLVADNGIDYM